MKRSIKSLAKIYNLCESVHQRVNMCSIATVVAVVSVLALAPPSQAKIVYTPVHVAIGEDYNLDLNRDGVTDFIIQNRPIWNGDCTVFDNVFEQPASGNGAVDSEYPLALTKGALIGHSQQFYVDLGTMATFSAHFMDPGTMASSSAHPVISCHQFGQGNWLNVADRYLGLRFQVKGRTHYAWARFNVQLHHDGTCEFRNSCYFSALLTGYAYETIPGKSIIAGQTKEAMDEAGEEDFGSGASLTSPIPDIPQPASLGMLALCARGIPLWRKQSILEGGLKGAL